MHKLVKIAIIFPLLVLCMAYGITQHVNAKKELSPSVLELLKACNITHNGTLKSVVEATQKVWLRQQGQERWEIKQTAMTAQQASAIYQLVGDMGFVHEVGPDKKVYDYALILGGNILNVRKRLAYLDKLCQAGIICKAVIILTGQRPLDPVYEQIDKVYINNSELIAVSQDAKEQFAACKTETDMIRFIFTHANISKELAAIPVVYIDTPMQTTQAGTLRRPNTHDTVVAWLAQKPVPGSCLAISCQPYVLYQDSVLRTILPQDFNLTTVGPTADSTTSIEVYLDTVARLLYQEQQRLT